MRLLEQDEPPQEGLEMDFKSGTVSFPIERRGVSTWWRMFEWGHDVRPDVMRFSVRGAPHSMITDISVEGRMGDVIDSVGILMYHALHKCVLEYGVNDTPANLLLHLNCVKFYSDMMAPIDEEEDMSYLRIKKRVQSVGGPTSHEWIRLPECMRPSTRRLVYLLMALHCHWSQLDHMLVKYSKDLRHRTG